MSKVAVIGGGASGLTAAIYAAMRHEVVVFERNSECGKKILATGNGKCNMWNKDQSLDHYHSSSAFIKDFFHENMDIFAFFQKLDLVPIEKEGYYYPHSKQAITVRNALERVALQNGVVIQKNFFIQEIKKENNQFILNPNFEHLVFDKVILACGSKCAPKTGSDGIGYDLAKSFSHTVVMPRPSLVQLYSDASFLKEWNGVRSEAEVTLQIDKNEIKKERGEIQLTKNGISGICVFNISRSVKEALDHQRKVEVKINFFPDCDDVFSFLEKRSSLIKDVSLDVFLEAIIPYKLAFVLLKCAHLSSNMTWNTLKPEEKRGLVSILTAFTIKIVDTNSFDEAQCCSGGVSLDEINLDTMESKLVSNLYIIGELLDVDGDCGGYNLGFAWLSGIKCGKNC